MIDKIKRIFIILVLILIFTNCATVLTTYKNNLKNYGDLVKIEIKKDKKNNQWIELKSKLIEPIVFYANFKIDETGDIEIYINNMKFLSVWANGWTQGEADVNAKLRLVKDNKYYRCYVEDNFEFFEITKGVIRFNDDYYYDEKGLTNVKNRFYRILTMNQFLSKQNEMPEFFYTPFFNSKLGISYKNKVEKILFPEMFLDFIVYKDKKFKITDPSSDLVLSETIFWNKKYTNEIFPEELREVRNSETMLRDFEEVLELCFAQYNLKYFFEKFLHEQKLSLVIKK